MGGVIDKDIVPSRGGQFKNQDDGGVLAAAGNQLEEQVDCFGFEGDLVDFVDAD